MGSQLPPDTGERAPARQVGTWFTYPGGMEGWVDLGVGYIPRWFTCPQTVTPPSSYYLIVTRPGVEPMTSRSQVQSPSVTLLSHSGHNKAIQQVYRGKWYWTNVVQNVLLISNSKKLRLLKFQHAAFAAVSQWQKTNCLTYVGRRSHAW